MREILFRAKWIDNGEWVEGFPFLMCWDGCEMWCIGVNPLSANDYSEIIGQNVDWFFIDPETICQYTGLKDKNGNRIWENDIVRIKNSMDEGIGNIEFYGGMWYVDGEPSNSLHDIVEYDDGELEVIGNIFDTPELLKGE